MKKKIVTTLLLTVAISMSACSKADVEKQPVIVEDSARLNLENPSATEPEEGALANEEDKDRAEEAKTAEAQTEVNGNDVAAEASGNDTAAEDRTANGNDVVAANGNDKAAEARAEAGGNDVAAANRNDLAAEAKIEASRNDMPAETRAEASANNVVAEDRGSRATVDSSREQSRLVASDYETDETMTVLIEGVKEKVRGKRFKSNLGYEIVYDSEKFKRETQEKTDSFLAENSDPTIYPYNYINISRLEDTTAKKYSKELYNRLLKDGLKKVSITDNTEIGQDSLKSAMVSVQTGDKWDSVIRNYYVIERAGKVFLIETQFYLDAQEGYGARIKAMLDTFYIP